MTSEVGKSEDFLGDDQSISLRTSREKREQADDFALYLGVQSGSQRRWISRYQIQGNAGSLRLRSILSHPNEHTCSVFFVFQPSTS
jgi:hypothetical protein